MQKLSNTFLRYSILCALVLICAVALTSTLTRHTRIRPSLPENSAFSTISDIILSDENGYTKGPYTAFMMPFNKRSLVNGHDYTESTRLNQTTFPAQTWIAWDWPKAEENDPIRGFLAIDYGNYYNTVPEVHIESFRVRDIRELICAYDLSTSGASSGFDAIIDFFLTSTPRFDKIENEIEVFIHTPKYAASYSQSVTSLGSFISKAGLVWKLSIDPRGTQAPDILVYPKDEADVLVGQVDLREILSWLMEQKVISGLEFFNGLAIGIEPQQGRASLAVNTFSVKYQGYHNSPTSKP